MQGIFVSSPRFMSHALQAIPPSQRSQPLAVPMSPCSCNTFTNYQDHHFCDAIKSFRVGVSHTRRRTSVNWFVIRWPRYWLRTLVRLSSGRQYSLLALGPPCAGFLSRPAVSSPDAQSWWKKPTGMDSSLTGPKGPWHILLVAMTPLVESSDLF